MRDEKLAREYRILANESLELAELTTEPKIRDHFRKMADIYLTLAELYLSEEKQE
jgi:hypothetical protein